MLSSRTDRHGLGTATGTATAQPHTDTGTATAEPQESPAWHSRAAAATS